MLFLLSERGSQEYAGAASMANANLNGCMAKRKLEAAKFLFMEGLHLILQDRWSEAAPLLQKACDAKDGWGWGVNNGEIFVALGSVHAILRHQLPNLRGDDGPYSNGLEHV